MTRVLGIFGSPRRKGNSELLLDQVLAGAGAAGAEVSSIRAASMKISGCKACGGCTETGRCVLGDGMQDVYPRLEQADRIVLASPIFFYGVPSQLKAFIDRAQAAWSKRMLVKTREERKRYDAGEGYLIAVGATKGKKLFEGVERVAKYFFDALDMDYRGGLFFRGVDEKGAIRDQGDALGQAYELGRRMAAEGG
jgi:multimeric flavodoxin WrbA